MSSTPSKVRIKALPWYKLPIQQNVPEACATKKSRSLGSRQPFGTLETKKQIETRSITYSRGFGLDSRSRVSAKLERRRRARSVSLVSITLEALPSKLWRSVRCEAVDSMLLHISSLLLLLEFLVEALCAEDKF